MNKNEVTADGIFEDNNKDNHVGGFLSTVNFFDDLIEVSEQLKLADPKIVALRTQLKELN